MIIARVKFKGTAKYKEKHISCLLSTQIEPNIFLWNKIRNPYHRPHQPVSKMKSY